VPFTLTPSANLREGSMGHQSVRQGGQGWSQCL